MSLSKMYIAVLDEVGDFMVPTLVAHSVLAGHLYFEEDPDYEEWIKYSFRKVVVRVNRKEFEKIRTTLSCWEGHESTTLHGEPSCLVVKPVELDIPNVLKFAKLWAPKP